MTSVGETLRAERVRKGLTLEQISRETKISARLLEAIENEQYERLPGGVFAKSFVRQYARILGLNSEELASEVQKSIHPQADQPTFPLAVQEPAYKVPKMKQWEGTGSHSNSSPLGSLVMVLVVMLGCAGIYVWWQRSRQPAPVAARPPVTGTASKPAPGPVTPAVSENPAPPPQTPVVQTEPSTSAANPAATLHVTLAADEPTWVRAWVDGKEAFTATLGPDKSKTADAEDEVKIRTGNAGCLQITVNGKPAGPVGPKGQIRIIQVTNKGVQVAEPPKPAPETDLEPL
jgi:cytoskeletal protein RodZ